MTNDQSQTPDWSAMECMNALRDRIAILDRKVARLTETVNRQDGQLSALASAAKPQVVFATDNGNYLMVDCPKCQGCGMEHPSYACGSCNGAGYTTVKIVESTAPDTVAVPASLVAAMADYMNDNNYKPNHFPLLRREYDAWKAGNGA